MDLCNISDIKALLTRHGFHFSKSMGQNFLIDPEIPARIAASSEADEHCGVLEIGPGIGTLTMALLQNAKHVTSIERDIDLPAVLAETLEPWWDSFTLIQKDALDLQLSDLDGQDAPNKLVANLPYAVAATVVLDYFQRIESLESATVMVQKEVADRMAAEPGTKNYGAYTVKLRLYAQPAGRFPVSPNNFFPPPRVDSAVIRLNRTPVLDAQGKPLDGEVARAACRRCVRQPPQNAVELMQNLLRRSRGRRCCGGSAPARVVRASGHRSQAPRRDALAGGVREHGQSAASAAAGLAFAASKPILNWAVRIAALFS